MTRRHAAALLLLVVFAAAGALLLARAARPAYPVSDIALTELYTREAARGRLLVGPYSRFGWHHPGPMLFYLLAPAYAIGGRNTAALHAGALVLSMIASAVAIAAGLRREPPLAIALAGAVALVAVRLPSLIVSPWNPHAVVLPALALVAVSATAAAGDAAALAIVAAASAFVAQSDAALVPFAGVLVLAAVAGAIAAARRDADRRARLRSALAAAAAVAAILWLPSIVEQLVHRPGNLTALLRFFAANGRPRPGFWPAAAVWSDALTAPLAPGFVLAHGGAIEPTVDSIRLAVACALTAGAAIASAAAFRRHRPVLAWFGALSAASSLIALWSVTRIEGVVADHLAFWQAAIGLADAASIAACLGAQAVSRAASFGARGFSRAAAPGLAAMMIVGAVGLQQVARAAAGSFAITVDAASAPNFAGSIRDYLARNHVRRPLFRIDQDQWGLAAAILLELDRERVRYAVEDDWASMFPDRFAKNGREDAELTLAATGEHGDLAGRPGNVTVDASSFIHVEAIPVTRARR